MSTRYNWYKFGRCLGGFSLIELLVVIGIASILFSLSVPSLHQIIERTRFKLLSYRLQHVLSTARSLAIIHHRRVSVCGSSDGQHCDGAWAVYWRIENTADRGLLRLFDQHLPEPTIAWHGNHSQRFGITFNALGETMGQQGRFQLKLGSYRQELILIASGRIRVVDTQWVIGL